MIFLRRHVHEASIQTDADPLGFSANRKRGHCRAGCHVDDHRRSGIFAVDIQPPTIAANGELLGVGNATDDARQRLGGQVEHANSVGEPVRGRQRALVDIRPGSSRATVGEIERDDVPHAQRRSAFSSTLTTRTLTQLEVI
jgi:hypothetical protein